MNENSHSYMLMIKRWFSVFNKNVHKYMRVVGKIKKTENSFFFAFDDKHFHFVGENLKLNLNSNNAVEFRWIYRMKMKNIFNAAHTTEMSWDEGHTNPLIW